jgi:hypothetical protein
MHGVEHSIDSEVELDCRSTFRQELFEGQRLGTGTSSARGMSTGLWSVLHPITRR